MPFEALGPGLRTRRSNRRLTNPLKEIGGDYLLIVKKDELGVPRLAWYNLHKTTSRSP